MTDRPDQGEQQSGPSPVGAERSVLAFARRLARWPRDRLACVAGCALGLACLAGGRLAWVWIAFDIFNHFVIHFAIVAAAFALASLLPRLRLLATAGIILAGILAIGIWPHLASGSDAKPASAGRTLRVMSFNTWLSNSDWQAVADEVTRHDPDIVTLIEFGEEKKPLIEALAVHYPFRTDCLERPYCHMALLSKFAFQSTQARTRWRGPAQIMARFGPELNGLTVVGVHSIRPPHFRSQFIQLRVLARQVAQMGGARIVMGDFNATPFSRMIATFRHRSGLERATWLPSWPARFGPLPQIAIDHIFLSPGLKLAGRARIGNNAGSDHYPVIADVILPADKAGE